MGAAQPNRIRPRDKGNSILVVEHKQEVIRIVHVVDIGSGGGPHGGEIVCAGDFAGLHWVIDLGPGAGNDGGRVVFEGPPANLVYAADSVTGAHLLRRRQQSAA